MSPYRLLIGGELVDAEDAATFRSTNPYSGQAWAEIADASAADAARAVRAARDAFDADSPWRRMPARDRGRLLRRLADRLDGEADRLAVLESTDNGKLLREMRAQTGYLPQWFEYYAGLADKVHGRSIPGDRDNFHLFTERQPVGVVAAVIPWNSPLLLMAWKVAPALAAGCPVVIKPSEHASVSTAAFAELVAELDFPPGVINVVTATDPKVAGSLVADPSVAKVAFTGSPDTAIQIIRSTAGNFTRLLLELGGKSPNIVFADADLEAAANGVVAGIFAAGGQTCIAGSRLLVHRSVHDELVERVADRGRRIELGDPLSEATDMGPMATAAQVEKVDSAVRAAVADGATAVCGGRRSTVGDLFYEPTVLCAVNNDMQVAQDEIFGPVLAVIPFEDEAQAVALANDSRFGLAAGVWTTSMGTALRVARRLRVGTVWVNAYRVVSYHAPFGGFGASGWGRESGPDALDEFTETKSIWVELSGATRDPFTIG